MHPLLAYTESNKLISERSFLEFKNFVCSPITTQAIMKSVQMLLDYNQFKHGTPRIQSNTGMFRVFPIYWIRPEVLFQLNEHDKPECNAGKRLHGSATLLGQKLLVVNKAIVESGPEGLDSLPDRLTFGIFGLIMDFITSHDLYDEFIENKKNKVVQAIHDSTRKNYQHMSGICDDNEFNICVQRIQGMRERLVSETNLMVGNKLIVASIDIVEFYIMHLEGYACLEENTEARSKILNTIRMFKQELERLHSFLD